MVVTFSDDEVSDHESENGQEGNFMAFTTTAIVSESEIVKETLLMGNSPRMLTCKRFTTSFAKLQQRMP